MSGSWTQITIAGKNADVFEPGNDVTPRRGIIHFHGHGLETVKDNPAFTQEFVRHGFAVVCPHGQRSWWLDQICHEFDDALTPMQYLRDAIVPFFDQRWNLRPPHIGLMGISMGGQGALQFAYRYPREFPVVAAISPAVDFHIWHGRELPLDDMFADAEAARQQTATLQLHPMNWPRQQMLVCDPQDVEWFEGAERLGMKLYSSGIPFTSDFETTVNGHTWDYFNHMAERVVGYLHEHVTNKLDDPDPTQSVAPSAGKI